MAKPHITNPLLSDKITDMSVIRFDMSGFRRLYRRKYWESGPKPPLLLAAGGNISDILPVAFRNTGFFRPAVAVLSDMSVILSDISGFPAVLSPLAAPKYRTPLRQTVRYRRHYPAGGGKYCRHGGTGSSFLLYKIPCPFLFTVPVQYFILHQFIQMP